LRKYARSNFLLIPVLKITAEGYRKIVHVLRKLGNLDKPELRIIICTAPVSEARKELIQRGAVSICFE